MPFVSMPWTMDINPVGRDTNSVKDMDTVILPKMWNVRNHVPPLCREQQSIFLSGKETTFQNVTSIDFKVCQGGRTSKMKQMDVYEAGRNENELDEGCQQNKIANHLEYCTSRQRYEGMTLLWFMYTNNGSLEWFANLGTRPGYGG